jgi:hypothetical protein
MVDTQGEFTDINPAANGSLQSIFRRYRRRIVLTYTLFILENLVRLAQPLAMGLAVSDLLQSSTRGMWVFIAQCAIQMVIGTCRNLYDTRTFSTITADLAGDLVLQQRGAQVETSRVAARSSLSREFAAFFERELPIVISTGFSLVGSLVMLVWFDVFWGVVCVGLSVSYALFARVLGWKSAVLNSQIHDLNEQEVNVVERHDEPEVRRHFSTIRNLQVKLSDWCGFSLGLTDLSLVLFLSIALLRWETLAAMSAGDLVAMIRYAVLFMMTLTNVPLLVQAIVRLRDIGRRLRSEPAVCAAAAA